MKLHVVVHPQSKVKAIEKDDLGTVHIYHNTPPIKGKANEVVIDMLSEYLRIRKSKILIISGQHSRKKIVETFE